MSAFAERVLANVREEIRDEVAYALELAGEPALLEALKELEVEANRLGPQLPYNAPTLAIRAALERARAAITKAEAR